MVVVGRVIKANCSALGRGGCQAFLGMLASTLGSLPLKLKQIGISEILQSVGL